MRFQKLFILIVQIMGLANSQIKWEIVSSNQSELIIHLKSKILSPDDLKPIDILIGLPSKVLPTIQVQSSNESYHPYKVNNKTYKTEWIQNQKVNDLYTGTLRLTPIKESNLFFESMIIRIPFDKSINEFYRSNKIHQYLLAPKIVNWSIAKNWIKPKKEQLLKETSLPEGTWIKFYLSKDGVYKISGNKLKSALTDGIDLDPRSIMLYTGSAF